MGRQSRTKKERRERDPDELARRLESQARLLARSAVSFDEGEVDEALNMATRARVLCHDGNGASLLSQLGLHRSLKFYDTVMGHDPGLLIDSALTAMRPSGPVAPLDHRPPVMLGWVRFSDWWRRPVMTVGRGSGPVRRRNTRADIVKWLANQDGGAHVDPKIDEDYDDARRAETWTYVQGSSGRTALMPIAASMRQIAHELLTTLASTTGVEPPNNNEGPQQGFSTFRMHLEPGPHRIVIKSKGNGMVTWGGLRKIER
jgi:hypothetical protein